MKNILICSVLIALFFASCVITHDKKMKGEWERCHRTTTGIPVR